jgi:hypothetical protein
MTHENLQTLVLILLCVSFIGNTITNIYHTRSINRLYEWMTDLSEIVSHKKDE